MGDLGFVIKTLGIAIVLVVLMQIRVGQKTIEQHSLTWIHHSSLGENLTAVSEGAVDVVTKGYHFTRSLFGNSDKEYEGETNVRAAVGLDAEPPGKYSWKIKRSDAYLRHQRAMKQNDESSNQ